MKAYNFNNPSDRRNEWITETACQNAWWAPSHLENVQELVPGDVADGVPVEAPEGRLDLVVTVPGFAL